MAHREDEAIQTFCGKIDRLAFLPVDRVSEGMAILKEQVPEELSAVLENFDITCVSGQYRAVMGPGGTFFAEPHPDSPPMTWNVHQATLTDGHRTNNVCESWNNGFKHLVGHTHPSIRTVIGCVKKTLLLLRKRACSMTEICSQEGNSTRKQSTTKKDWKLYAES